MAKNSRVRGRSQSITGKAKQCIGKRIGNVPMEAAGSTEMIQGEADKAATKASERIVGAGQELSGSIKPVVGDLIDSSELSIEGQAEPNRGKRHQRANLYIERRSMV